MRRLWDSNSFYENNYCPDSYDDGQLGTRQQIPSPDSSIIILGRHTSNALPEYFVAPEPMFQFRRLLLPFTCLVIIYRIVI
jgi:hypothetical protein